MSDGFCQINVMFDPPRDRLLHPLLLSLAIHLALLLGVSSELPVRPAPSAVAIKVVLGVESSHERRQPALVVAPKPALPRKVQPAPPVRQFVVEQPAAFAVQAPAIQLAPAETSSADRSASSVSLQGSPVALPNDATSADDLRQYRVELAIAARRFRRYPGQARERGWEGVTEVALSVSAHLPVPEVILVRSSGHPVLDRQALEMMTQAARAAVLPESLRGRDLRIMLPVRFSLEADQ